METVDGYMFKKSQGIYITSKEGIVFEVSKELAGMADFDNFIGKPANDCINLLINSGLYIYKVEKQDDSLKFLFTRIREDKNADFIYFITHELKTPISIIVSAIQTMEKLCKNDLTAKARVYIERIKHNTNKQLRLVNSLLDISKAESGYMNVYKKNLDIVSYTKALVESVHLYAKEKGIEIRFNTLIDSIDIAMDQEKFERIILNLLSNAIKFTPEGKYIYVNIYKLKESICIEVRDEGTGIPANEISKIFDRYKQVDSGLTRREGGTGIGLSLVKQLVRILDGNILVTSDKGKGSSFKVFFPNKKNIQRVIEEEKQYISREVIQKQVSIEFSDL